MNENNETQHNEAGTPDSPNGTYHYIRPEQTRAHTAPPYNPNPQPAQSGGGQQPPHDEPPRGKEEKPRKFRKAPGWGGVIAVALCCAILGGVVGGVVTQKVGGSGNSPTVLTTAAPSSGKNSGTTVASTNGKAMSAEDIYSLACEQVVGVTTEVTYTNWFGQTSSSAVSGSGFIISKDGYILTNYHVIETAVQNNLAVSVMLHDSTQYEAKVVGYEADNDVAVLKIDCDNLNAVTLGDSDELSVGETVYAVGNPLGELAYTMTTGSVSALDRAITTDEYAVPVNMFQLDAAVNSGNSGGPVYNNRGEVVGIVTAKNGSTGVEGLGFAIPINDAVEISTDLITNGRVTGKAYMGVTGVTVSETAAEYYNLVQGAAVNTVAEGSAAEKAGLTYGDIITKLGDYTVTSWDDLNSAVRKYKAGETATVEFYRNGETKTAEITFAERPAEADQQQEQSQSQQDQQQGQQFQIPNMGDFNG